MQSLIDNLTTSQQHRGHQRRLRHGPNQLRDPDEAHAARGRGGLPVRLRLAGGRRHAAERLQPRRLHELADGRREQARVAAFRALHRREPRHAHRSRCARARRSMRAADPDLVLHLGGGQRIESSTAAELHGRRHRRLASRRSRRRCKWVTTFSRSTNGRTRMRTDDRVSADRPHLLRRDGDAMRRANA